MKKKQVNYAKRYAAYIGKAREAMLERGVKRIHQVRQGKTFQGHHINPKVLGGSNELNNFVLLKQDDHMFAHFLLDLALCQLKDRNKIKQMNFIWAPITEMLETRKYDDVYIKVKHCGSNLEQRFTFKEAAKRVAFFTGRDWTDKKQREKAAMKLFSAALRKQCYLGKIWDLDVGQSNLTTEDFKALVNEAVTKANMKHIGVPVLIDPKQHFNNETQDNTELLEEKIQCAA